MDIVDVIVGERGPEADVNLLRKQQPNFSDEQSFKGDKAYIGADRTTTPQKKPPKRELTPEQKADATDMSFHGIRQVALREAHAHQAESNRLICS